MEKSREENRVTARDPDVRFIVPARARFRYYLAMKNIEIIQNCRSFLNWNSNDIRGLLKKFLGDSVKTKKLVVEPLPEVDAGNADKRQILF